MPKAKTGLEADFEFFEQHRKEWDATHRGEFVVIGGCEVSGFYKDYEAALRAGLQHFGIQKQFLVKQVWIQEPVFVIY